MSSAFKTPILFCVFNRPELTARVFESIRNIRPDRLFVSCDGPRDGHSSDAGKVKKVRKIVSQVDWPCEVHERFADSNLGCKQAMSSAISWAFENTESLIILEDDCLPDPSFFPYCEELLIRYHDRDDVMMISGNNFQSAPRSDASYYFSRWTHIWGWATWKHAWEHFDVDVSSWPRVKESGLLKTVFADPIEYQHWSRTLDSQFAGKIDTWDFPWAYAVWENQGLSVLPNQNLVTNIGFGAEATHTTDPESKLAGIPVSQLRTMTHPKEIGLDHEADRFTWEKIFLPGVALPDTDESTWKKKMNSFRHWFRNRTKVA